MEETEASPRTDIRQKFNTPKWPREAASNLTKVVSLCLVRKNEFHLVWPMVEVRVNAIAVREICDKMETTVLKDRKIVH